jgi:hypothetical protein
MAPSASTLSAERLQALFEQAKLTASRTGKIWCNDVYQSCKSLCFCAELEPIWENISTVPLPFTLKLLRQHRLKSVEQASAIASEQSGVYSSAVSDCFALL